jgi:glutamyl-tRNA reductase
MARAVQITSQDGLEVDPTIDSLREWGEGIRQKELARLRAKLKTLSSETEKAVDALTVSLTRKILGGPISHLEEQALRADATTYVQVARTLFRLED